MKIRLEFVKREIAGEVFLVPFGESAKEFSGLFALNELGSFIWDILPEAESEEQIVNRILDEYDVTREIAEADTKEFLDKLREMKILA